MFKFIKIIYNYFYYIIFYKNKIVNNHTHTHFYDNKEYFIGKTCYINGEIAVAKVDKI